MKKKINTPLDQILKALADPIRLGVIKQLIKAPEHEMACGTFNYEVSKPTFSHHIKTLVDAGVLIERVEGVRKFLSINKELEKVYPELFDLIARSK